MWEWFVTPLPKDIVFPITTILTIVFIAALYLLELIKRKNQ